ncbi:MAG: hypothetical protein LBV74_00250 [Tannerella sp.]|nr:hypothetical protein [Tannerella sp.]
MGGTASGSPKYSMVGAGLVGLGGLDAGFGLGGILGGLFGGGSNSGQSSFSDLPSFSTDLPSIGNDRPWHDRAWNDLVNLWDSIFASDDHRSQSPPARRDSSDSRKDAYEKAKRTGGDNEPIHHPNGHNNNTRPHYHPDVPNAQRQTPHQPSSHDHYFYPQGK